MKRIITFAIIVIALCCTFQCLAKVFTIESSLYCGKKRGVMSSAVFFLKVEDSIAFIEQYREFGGVLYLDLKDSLYLNEDNIFVGEKTYVTIIGNDIKLKNLKEKISWTLDVKLKKCDENGHRQYDVYKNRLLLDTLDFQNISMENYRPLVDKACHMSHQEFKKEVDLFIRKYKITEAKN